MLIYRIGADGYWTGETGEISEADGAPMGWTRAAPPPLGAAEYAVWAGRWVVTATAPTTTPVLRPLTRRRLLLGLLNVGVSEADVTAQIDALPAGAAKDVAMIEWLHASEYRRDHPLIDQIGAGFALTPAQIDALWLYASDL